jgi:L-rhamnose mutarotase
MGTATLVRPQKLDTCKKLHAEPWPKMNAHMSAAHIQICSIFLREPENLLFGYLEYVGSDFAAETATQGELPVTKRGLDLTDPCREPLASTTKGEGCCIS